jgi:hypothetical protein
MDSGQTAAESLLSQDPQGVSQKGLLGLLQSMTEESRLLPEVTPTLHKGKETAPTNTGKVKLSESGYSLGKDNSTSSARDSSLQR